MLFEELIAPLSIDAFLRDYLHTRYLLVQKDSRDVEKLLPWAELNAILDTVTYSTRRIRLVREGKDISPDDYTIDHGAEADRTLNSAALQGLVRDGATLVLNGVDRLSMSVQGLAESLERVIGVHAGVNLYAGWRRQRGFDLHWDSHDTFIVQIHGVKHWTVYQPTGLYPLGKDCTKDRKPRPDELVWEGDLTAGSLLYMPAGWWHVAVPLDKASVHLTFSVSHPTWLQFLRWLVKDLAETQGPFRRPIWFTRDDVRGTELDSIRGPLTEALEPNSHAFHKFVEELDRAAFARPSFALPQVVDSSPEPMLGDGMSLRLARGRHVVCLSDGPNGMVHLAFGPDRWSCSRGLWPALQMLSNTQSVELGRMAARVQPQDRVGLKIFLHAMLIAGALQVSPQPEHILA